MTVPELEAAVRASTTKQDGAGEDDDGPEITQALSLNSLLPFDAKHERKTDWRITRAWCKGKNTDPITDRIEVGRTASASNLADKLCGKVRLVIPTIDEQIKRS